MKKHPFRIFWRNCKLVFFFVFLVHIFLFFIFLFKKVSVVGFTISNLPFKLAVFFIVAGLIAFIYIAWLRNIKSIKRLAIFIREVFFITYISSTIFLFLGIFFNPLITLTQLGSLVTGHGLHKHSVSYNAMSSNAKLAVIAAEDQLFPDHDGFDVRSIQKAIKYNAKNPTKQRGASTISQQVAKNVFLWQGGGFIRKGLEVYFTWSIEKIWSKETILARYLNVAEMGEGIFGIDAAAQAYFGKPAQNLSQAEAAQIAACLPNPKKYTVNPMSKYVAARYQRIVAQMKNLAGDEDIKALLK